MGLFLCNLLLSGNKCTFKVNSQNTLKMHIPTLKGLHILHTKLYGIWWYWAQLIFPKFVEFRWNDSKLNKIQKLALHFLERVIQNLSFSTYEFMKFLKSPWGALKKLFFQPVNVWNSSSYSRNGTRSLFYWSHLTLSNLWLISCDIK